MQENEKELRRIALLWIGRALLAAPFVLAVIIGGWGLVGYAFHFARSAWGG